MYYRLGDRVKIERKVKGKPDVWSGMTGKIAHITTPKNKEEVARNFGFGWMYGIELDEKDVFGKNKIIMWTKNPNTPHPRITKIDSSELHPKFLDYRHFKL